VPDLGVSRRRSGAGDESARFSVVPQRPYSLALTAARYARFPEVVDRFDGAVYRRFLPVGRGGALLSVEQVGTPARAVLEVTLAGPQAGSGEIRSAADRIVHVALGAAQPVAPFYRAFREDPVIGAAIRDFRGLRGAGVPSLWEALVTAILAQQVNLQFAYDIRRELSETFGKRARFDAGRFIGFPTPESMASETPAKLRRFRLSESKAKAIHGLARAFAGGVLGEGEIARLSDEAAIERLTAFRGVGRWTAEIALLRGMGRADIFPAGDLGVVKYLAQGLLGRREKAKEDAMRRFAERWKPWRGLALVYGYAELNRRRAGSPSRPAPRGPRRAPGSARSPAD
jgi:DNA-3-methyladenine glycosylase II